MSALREAARKAVDEGERRDAAELDRKIENARNRVKSVLSDASQDLRHHLPPEEEWEWSELSPDEGLSNQTGPISREYLQVVYVTIDDVRLRGIFTAEGTSGWHTERQVLVGSRGSEDVWVEFHGLEDLGRKLDAGVPEEKPPPRPPVPTNGDRALELLNRCREFGYVKEEGDIDGPPMIVLLTAASVYATLELVDAIDRHVCS